MLVDPVWEAARAAGQLIVYHRVLSVDPVLRSLAALVRALADEGRSGPQGLWGLVRSLTVRLLDDRPGRGDEDLPAPTPWHPHVVEALLAERNPFTRAASRCPSPERMPAALLTAARHDLRCLQALARVQPEHLRSALAARGVRWPAGVLESPGEMPDRDGGQTGAGAGGGASVARAGAGEPPGGGWPVGRAASTVRPRRDLVVELHRRLSRSADWAQEVEELIAYHRAVGAGVFGQFAVLRWQPGRPRPDGHAGPRRTSRGRLVGVSRPDPTRLEDLVGYERQRARVVDNTERFVRGLPAHHLLLYGPRGTGKSATVKALVHAFCDRGLRLVELPAHRLADLAEVVELLGDEPQRFILFVDDLSFDGPGPEYRSLKAALEGRAQAWPPNVLVYATTNRRHFVQEQPRDDGLARPEDEVNERIALADRFGLTVVFLAPDQELYLDIVEGLARRAGLLGPDAPGGGVDIQALRERAVRWALWNNERSPRTAVQFITELLGERGRANDPASPGAPAPPSHSAVDREQADPP